MMSTLWITRWDGSEVHIAPHKKHDPGARPYGSKLLMYIHRNSKQTWGKMYSHTPWKFRYSVFLLTPKPKTFHSSITQEWNYLSYEENWLCSEKQGLLPWPYEKSPENIYRLINHLGNYIPDPEPRMPFHAHTFIQAPPATLNHTVLPDEIRFISHISHLLRG